MNYPENRIAETIAKAWELTNAQMEVEESAKTRIPRLADAMNGTCVEPVCMWFERAAEVLSLNNFELATFAKAMYNRLNEGRRKHRNIMRKHSC